MKKEIEVDEAIRELKCLVSHLGITPRTEKKSLLNEKLNRRAEILTFIIRILENCDEGKIEETLWNNTNYKTGVTDLKIYAKALVKMLRGER